MAAELTKALEGKTVLGLLAAAGIPARPAGPAVACRIRLTGSEASVQVTSSDATAQNWVAFGKFTQPVVQENGKVDAVKFADALAEGSSTGWSGSVDQGLRPERKGQADLPDSDRERLSAHPQRAGAGRDGEQGRRSAQGAVGHRHSSAPKHARSHERGGRQDAGAEEGIKVLALDLSGL